MKPIRNLIIFITAIAFAGCNYSSIRMNAEVDKPAGEKITFMFFNDLQKQDYNATYPLFSQSFWDVVPKSKIENIFKTSKAKLGLLKDMSLVKWESRVVAGTNPSAEYQYQYKTTYEKGEAIETFRLIEEKGKVKIIAYNINSDEFFK